MARRAMVQAIGLSIAGKRQLAWLAIVAMLLGPVGHAAPPAAAQALPGLTAEQATAAAPAEAQTPADQLRAELEALLKRLENPEATRELAASVRALLDTLDAGGAAAEPVVEAETDKVGEALSRARPAAAELFARIDEDLRQRAEIVREAAEQVYETTRSVPNLLAWTRKLIDEPAEKRALAQAAAVIIVILGAGLLTMWLVARGLTPARRALVFRERDRPLSRWIMALLLILLRIIPVLVFAIVANALIVILQPNPVTKIWLSAGVSAIVMVRLGLVLAQAVLSPAASQARLVPLSDAAARLLTTYLHELLALGVYGYTLLSVLEWHGMPWGLRGTLDRLVALALLISALWIVIRHRREVARWLGRLAESGHDASSIPWRRIGAVWHVFAIIYLCALFVIYNMEELPLFIDVLITSSLSLCLLIGLIMALRYVEGKAGVLEQSLDPDDSVADDQEDRDAEERPAPPRRRSGLLIALRIAIVAVAIVTFLQVWGFDSWLLFTGDGPGERLALILVVIGVIYLLWFAINRFIAGYIRRLDAEGGAARSSTRTRTVLVLARNAALVTLCVIGGMVILSELGLNIGPLLAGAGVIGIAIGFGAQHLVQDIITGLFNLVEDTFAVGDVVDLSGKTGVVEAVTIRTVRLRDLSGNVHTIPFSAIAVVTNMTKDFSFAAFDIGVAYRESVDEVMRVIHEVAEDLRRERAYRRVILAPLEMLGVDAFADSAVMIKCRFRVRPGSQWMIKRELNRRLKNRFDELGIEIPFPHQTVYFGQDRSGAAPPAHVVMEAAERHDEAREPEPSPPRAVPRLAD